MVPIAYGNIFYFFATPLKMQNRTDHGTLKLGPAPLKGENKCSKSQGCLYAGEPARAHSLNAKDNNSNGSSWPEVLVKTWQFGLAQTKPSRLCSYLGLEGSDWIISFCFETVCHSRLFCVQTTLWFPCFPCYKGAQPNFSVPWAGHFCNFNGVAIK